MELKASIMLMERLEREAVFRERLLSVKVDRGELAAKLIAERLDEINGDESRKELSVKDKVLAVINRSGSEGIRRNSLTRALGKMRGSSLIEIVVESLIETGLVTATVDKGARGRPAMIYTATHWLGDKQ